MNVLIVCAGGLSTGVLVRKMKKYWKEQNENLQIKACGLNDYEECLDGPQAILVGPQVAYKIDEIREKTHLPVEVIDGNHYALGDCAALMEQLKRMIDNPEKSQETKD